MAIFDLNLGVKNQPLTLLRHMSEVDYDWLGIKDKYDFDIKTSAFYNGREDGIVLEVSSWSINRTKEGNRGQLYIYFGENRSSDNIFVSTWIVDRQGARLNPATVLDLPEAAYHKRKYFDYAQYEQASSHICSLIKSYVEQEYKLDAQFKDKKEK